MDLTQACLRDREVTALRAFISIAAELDRVTARDRDAEPPSGTSAERGWYARSSGKDNIDSAESAQRRQRVAHILDGPAPKGAQRPHFRYFVCLYNKD